jgi:hypothetical protein
VTDADTLARLAALSDEAFGQFAATVAGEIAPDGTVSLAPPSPAGGVDAVVECERPGGRHLVHVRRQAAPGRTAAGLTDETDAPDTAAGTSGLDGTAGPAFDATDLREVLTVGASFDEVVVVVAGDVTTEARRAASAADVRLLDGDDFVSLLRRRDLDVPRPESMAARFDRLLERQASEWPPAVRDLAARVLAGIESVAAFDHRIVHADETTDVDFLLGGDDGARAGTASAARDSESMGARPPTPVVRARLTETEFRVYVVAADGQFECVTTLSAIRGRERTPAAVLGDVLPAVERAVERQE